MNKAVFLDRDGVINRDKPGVYTYKISDLVINEDVIESLKILHGKGYLLIIITNQGGISKGIYKKEDVEVLHKHLEGIFNKAGITIAEIYYCPHHSDIEKCLCRKPGSILLEKAISRFNIDPSSSYLIGDKESDIIAGKQAHLNTVMIDMNSSIKGFCENV